MTPRTVFVVRAEGEYPAETRFDDEETYENWKQHGKISGLLTAYPNRKECIKFGDLVEGATYTVPLPPGGQQLKAVQQYQAHRSKGNVDELGRHLENLGQKTQERDMKLAPQLCELKSPGTNNVITKLDVVVLGEKCAFIANHELFVENSTPICDLAGRASTIEVLGAQSEPGYTDFKDKKIVPYFMAETYKSSEVEANVQQACDKLGVKRLVRKGNAIGPAEAMEQDVGAGERDSGARVPQAEDTALLGESPK